MHGATSIAEYSVPRASSIMFNNVPCAQTGKEYTCESFFDLTPLSSNKFYAYIWQK